MTLKIAEPGDAQILAARGCEALAHLLACLDNAVRCLDECMFDVDARIVEAHRAQLARGREWPGDPVTPWEPDEPPDEPMGSAPTRGGPTR